MEDTLGCSAAVSGQVVEGKKKITLKNLFHPLEASLRHPIKPLPDELLL